MKWHQLETNEALREGNTRLEGLTPTEVEERQKQYGPNRLPEAEDVSKLRLLLHQFTSPLIYILLVAAIVTALLREYIDTGVIVAVVILNAIVGFFQEYKAETSVRALRNMVVARARVVRDGKEMEIPTEELVPGDIVVLASGAKVPADLRLMEAMELRIEEATLTGESVPVEKTVHAITEEHLTAGDQTNMAFMGTAVVNGRARGIVVETGAKTILGGIARDVQELSVTETPLQKKIVKFAQFIGLLVLGSATAIIVLGLFLGMTSVGALYNRSGGFCGHCPGRASHCGDSNNGHRDKPHGKTQRHHTKTARRGNTGEHNHHLFRQDRNTDKERNDRQGRIRWVSRLRSHRERL